MRHKEKSTGSLWDTVFSLIKRETLSPHLPATVGICETEEIYQIAEWRNENYVGPRWQQWVIESAL